MARQVGAFLACIIMSLTWFISCFGGVCEIAIAKISKPFPAKCVSVRYGSPKTQPFRVAGDNTGEFFVRKRAFEAYLNTEIVNGTREDGDWFSDCCKSGGRKIELRGQWMVADASPTLVSYLKGGCCAGIPNVEMDLRNCGGHERVCADRLREHNPNVSPQLALLHIGGGSPLAVGESSCESSSDSGAHGNDQGCARQPGSNPVYPVAMLLGSIAAVVVGIWQIAFRDETTAGVVCGLILEVCGLLLFVVSAILFGLQFIVLPRSSAAFMLSNCIGMIT